LTKHSGFQFELNARDPSALPKEYPKTEGDRPYFLDGYKHPTMDDEASLKDHIEAAMAQINKEMHN
jgi:guanylate cyclase soluble subunit alpha